MPQIVQLADNYMSQIFWLLITFGIIYFGIARMMLPKVEAAVDARNRKIAGDLAAAEAARDEAEMLETSGDNELHAAQAQAQAKSNSAKLQAARDSEKRLADANAEIAATLLAAQGALSEASASAMASIENVAAQATADIVTKVSGIKVTPAAAEKAVKLVMANG